MNSGWVLMEALVAMVVLSVAVIAMNRAFAEAVATRAIARDYTQARFFLEQALGELELKPIHDEGATGSGNFGEEHSRFSYTWSVTRIDVAPPTLPGTVPFQFQEALRNFEPPIEYLGEITVQVQWTRSDRSYSIETTTAVPPGGIRIPEEDDFARAI